MSYLARFIPLVMAASLAACAAQTAGSSDTGPERSSDQRPASSGEPSAIVLVGGEDGDREFSLPDPDGEPFSIGRAESRDISLRGGKVSREHARLEYRDGELWIVDLKSVNGTTVNGKSISESPLAVGDVIGIGDFTLEVR